MVYIILTLLVLFFALVIYFFFICFVRSNNDGIDDFESKRNRFLKPYYGVIKPCMDFLEQTDYKEYETVSFDGLKLNCRYYDCKSDKTVLLFHGYRSSAKHDFSCAVKMYYQSGFNILLADQRSHGKSEGKLITFGVKESRDVVSWVEFVNAKFAPKQIVLSGLSMGATTVLLSLKYKMPENVKCVIADCGFTSPVDIIKKVAKQEYKINGWLFVPIMDFLCKLFGKFSIRGISTKDTVKNTKIPILLIHGTSDDFVPCEMSEITFSAAKDHAKLVTVTGAGHGLSFLVNTNFVTKQINLFLKENLG